MRNSKGNKDKIKSLLGKNYKNIDIKDQIKTQF